LKHKSHLPPQSSNASIVELGHAFAINKYLALGRFLLAEEQLQQRRLSGTAGPGQENKLSFVYLQIDIPESCSVRRVHF